MTYAYILIGTVGVAVIAAIVAAELNDYLHTRHKRQPTPQDTPRQTKT